VPDTNEVYTFLEDYNNFLASIDTFTHKENITDEDRNSLR